jgi:hypothetical protein
MTARSKIPASEQPLVADDNGSALPGSTPSSQLIAKVLSPALKLWLMTQVESATELQVNIQSSDRMLLRGRIQQVQVSARQVIYQGLHLSQIDLIATGIRINLGQILKGKPLKLLEPVPIAGELRCLESDLNHSLQSSLLADALTEFLTSLLKIGQSEEGDTEAGLEISPPQIKGPQITVNENHVQIISTLATANGQQQPVGLQMALALASPHELLFQQLAWLPQIPLHQRIPPIWDDFKIDLGTEVNLQHLELSQGELLCRAKLEVMP